MSYIDELEARFPTKGVTFICEVQAMRHGEACATVERLRVSIAASRARCEELEKELESHVWEISPAMAQAKIDELNAKVASLASENAKLREDKERLDWLLATGNICVVRQIKGCDTTWDKPTTRERIDWHINHPDDAARKSALRPGATEPHGEETKNL